MACQVPTGLISNCRASYGTFQSRSASLRTCGMNEPVSWSVGCRLPPTLNWTVPQAAGPCAIASGGPPALARNVSRIPPPRGGGQGASGPIVDSWRLSTSAASRPSAHSKIFDQRPTGPQYEPERADDAEVPAAAKPYALLPSKTSQSRCIYTPTPAWQINRFV